MSDDVLQHVFEPLFTTKRSSGTGLGLTVVHQSVLQHGGHVFVESAPGIGTTIHLFLPVAVERDASPRPEKLLNRLQADVSR